MVTRIIITGGHHTGALPVIEEFKKQRDTELFWIGHKYPPLEYKEITDLGLPFYELLAGKVYRNKNILKLLRVPIGFLHALSLVIKIKPNVILSFGGYVAAPVVFAGWLCGVPAVTHEQTVTIGYANKFISIFAKKIFVSWEQSASHFPKSKVIYTGLPLRKDIFDIKSDSFKVNKDLPTIYVTAGKTGSKTVNDVVWEALENLLGFANVIHQAGRNENAKKDGDFSAKPGKYFFREYVEKNEIGEVFAKADLIVGRAGAHIVSEIMELKKPAVLIPIPWASHNEQFKNAQVVKDAGLGEILEEENLTPENLLNTIKQVLESLQNYDPEIAPDTKRNGLEDTARIIVNETLTVSKEKTPSK